MTYDHMKDPSRFQDVVLGDPLPVPDIWLTKRIRELEAANNQLRMDCKHLQIMADEREALKAHNQRLREALGQSTHSEHTLAYGAQCRCGQCEFVRLRDKALKGMYETDTVDG
jgi:regulator of replication initiation timing